MRGAMRRGRDPVRAGAVGLVACAIVVALAMNAGRLPLIGHGGREVSAQLADASGLRVGDRVEVAGVDVGRVEDMWIGEGHIVTTFTVDESVRLGDATTARIKVGNLLGSKYLELVPAGAGPLDDTIPLSRTEPAYDLTTAFEDLTQTVEPIDTDQLESALGALAETFRGAGGDVRSALRGMSRLSRTVASRDEELDRLLQSSALLTGTLDGSREDVAALLRDAAVLLDELDRRRDAIRGLVVHTRELTVQVRGLVRDNEQEVGPALDALGEVADQLESRQQDLRATLRGVVKFARVFVNTIGGGPWFDSFIGNAPDNLEIEEAR